MDNGTIGAWAGVVVAILGIFVGTLTGCGEPFKAPLFDDETGGGGSDSGAATGSTSTGTGSTVTDPGTGGAGGEPATTCEHSVCGAGEALDPSCDPCVATVCEKNDFCCSTGWTVSCVSDARDLCGVACAPTTCAHSPCEVGAPLPGGHDNACDLTVYRVCDEAWGNKPDCCTTAWGDECVHAAVQFGLVCQ